MEKRRDDSPEMDSCDRASELEPRSELRVGPSRPFRPEPEVECIKSTPTPDRRRRLTPASIGDNVDRLVSTLRNAERL